MKVRPPMVVGEKSNVIEFHTEISECIFQTYIKTSNIPRNGEPTVEIIDQGSEPAEFTQHFKSWNDTLFKSVRLFRRTFRYYG